MTIGSSSTYAGSTLVSAGTLLVTGALANSNVSVDAAATFGGSGSLGGDLTFGINSFLTIVDLNTPLTVTGAVTFGSGFGIDNILGINWQAVDLDTPYTLLANDTDFSSAGLDHFGIDNAHDVGGGRSAYFENGSLQVVVIPEPRAAFLGGLGMLFLLRRRRS
jgi:autotransporter-associated beta strand protein